MLGMGREVYSILAKNSNRKLQDSQDDEMSDNGENSGDSQGQGWSYALK